MYESRHRPQAQRTLPHFNKTPSRRGWSPYGRTTCAVLSSNFRIARTATSCFTARTTHHQRPARHTRLRTWRRLLYQGIEDVRQELAHVRHHRVRPDNGQLSQRREYRGRDAGIGVPQLRQHRLQQRCDVGCHKALRADHA